MACIFFFVRRPVIVHPHLRPRKIHPRVALTYRHDVIVWEEEAWKLRFWCRSDPAAGSLSRPTRIDHGEKPFCHTFVFSRYYCHESTIWNQRDVTLGSGGTHSWYVGCRMGLLRRRSRKSPPNALRNVGWLRQNGKWTRLLEKT